jgi:hypothetical protein
LINRNHELLNFNNLIIAKCSNREGMESNNNVGVAHEVMEGNEQNVHGI